MKDNGVGIPLEMQDRVFEIFSQIHQPTEIVTSGLGIGLSLVKSLVEIHGGSIELLSDGPDQGSEFRIRLPILTNPRRNSSQPARPTRPSYRPPSAACWSWMTTRPFGRCPSG